MSIGEKNSIDYCPVCHMQAVPKISRSVYQGSSFGFCSQQCLDRFHANPGLYIGRSGMPAAKQQGVQVIKQRVIRLDSPASEVIQQQLMEALLSMMGIKQVSIEGDLIRICYDLLEATAEQIEEAIEQSGARLGKVWKDRLKRAFVHYVEETEVKNLEQQHESHGCHH